MAKAVEQWTDARLNDLATALAPVPAQVAVLTVTVERLAEENHELRAEIAAMQRQLLQISWGLVAALVGAVAALIAGAV